MADTTTETPAEPDYLKRAAGTFATLGDMSGDSARGLVLSRVGVPEWVPQLDDKGKPQTDTNGKPIMVPHPMRKGVIVTHASAPSEPWERLPMPFPPTDYDGPLKTAADYLSLIDDTLKAQKADAKAKDDADKAKQDAKADTSAGNTAPAAPVG